MGFLFKKKFRGSIERSAVSWFSWSRRSTGTMGHGLLAQKRGCQKGEYFLNKYFKQEYYFKFSILLALLPWREVAFSPNIGSFTVLPSTTIHHGGGVRLNALPAEKKVIGFFTITTKKRTQAFFFFVQN